MLSISPHILYTLVNLLILFLLLRKFLFRPVLKILDARSQTVADTLADAESRQEDAKQLQAQYESRLQQADSEALAIVQEARKQAEALYAQRSKEAQEEAQRLLEQAQRQIEAEREQMMQSLRQEVAMLAIAVAAKVSGQQTAEMDRALLDAFLVEAGDAK